MSTECLCIDGSEVDRALVLLCDGLEVNSELVAFFFGLSKDIGKWDTGLYKKS